jgi:two-component system, OmpR family, alkaline phosphatase synthesis response regulator PhoP
MAERRKVLVVDDEAHIAELLVMNLRQNGYETCVVDNGTDVIATALAEKPDLILLDLMLPGIGGLEVCRLLKTDPRTAPVPVIMLTAKSEESDKVIGLGIGADDYVTKPFGLRELLARIEALLRRTRPVAAYGLAAGETAGLASGFASGVAEDPAEILDVGTLAIDLYRHEVRCGQERIALSPIEFSLLAAMARLPGKALKRCELVSQAGLAEGSESGRSLDVHMRNLRRKLGDLEDSSPKIETVRGIGYRLHG